MMKNTGRECINNRDRYVLAEPKPERTIFEYVRHLLKITSMKLQELSTQII